MKVKDVMMRTPASCDATTNLVPQLKFFGIATVEFFLSQTLKERRSVSLQIDTYASPWERGIGCQARSLLAKLSRVRFFTCKPDDDIRDALNTMAREKVRRLPVINDAGQLEGILSMDDVVLHSEGGIAGKTSELSHDTVVNTLKQVYLPDLPVVLRQKAAGA